jgi:hypothetical protein
MMARKAKSKKEKIVYLLNNRVPVGEIAKVSESQHIVCIFDPFRNASQNPRRRYSGVSKTLGEV